MLNASIGQMGKKILPFQSNYNSILCIAWTAAVCKRGNVVITVKNCQWKGRITPQTAELGWTSVENSFKMTSADICFLMYAKHLIMTSSFYSMP